MPPITCIKNLPRENIDRGVNASLTVNSFRVSEVLAPGNTNC